MSDQDRESSPVPQLYSRRAFLKEGGKRAVGAVAAIAVADSALAHVPFIGKAAATRSIWEAVESGAVGADVNKMRQDLEATYPLKILTASEAEQLKINTPDFKDANSEWDASHLKILKEFLERIPPSLYTLKDPKDGNVLPINLVLKDTPIVDLQTITINDKIASYCNTINLSGERIVTLNKLMFSPISMQRNDAWQLLVHELTHVKTGPEIDKYTQMVKPIVGDDLTKTFSDAIEVKIDYNRNPDGSLAVTKLKNGMGTVPYTKEEEDHLIKSMNAKEEDLVRLYDGIYVSKALLDYYGEKYFAQEDYDATIDYVRNHNVTVLVSGAEKTVRQKDPHNPIGYGATNFNEFFSVGSQLYSVGKDQFMKSYLPYLGEDRARKFYDFVKINFFEGREY